MAYHFIAITSDYAQGQRIAWHYATEEKLDTKRIKSFLQKTKISFPNIAFGIHKLSTSSTSWESVVEKDSFFEDVCANADEDVFLKYLDFVLFEISENKSFLIVLKYSTFSKSNFPKL